MKSFSLLLSPVVIAAFVLVFLAALLTSSLTVRTNRQCVRDSSSSFRCILQPGEEPLQIFEELKTKMRTFRRVYHMHIPKTGGTTISRRVSTCNSDPLRLKESEISSLLRTGSRCIISSEDKLSRIPAALRTNSTFFVTTVRDKKSWAISAFNHMKATTEKYRNLSFRDVYANNEGYFTASNLYSEYITSEFLSDFNYMICDTDLLEKCLSTLKFLFDFDVYDGRTLYNARDEKETVPKDVLDTVMGDNVRDTNIYRRFSGTIFIQVYGTRYVFQEKIVQ